MSANFTLKRDGAGRLVYSDPNQGDVAGVVPVRAFPISAAEESLSLVGPDGHELAWIADLATLPSDVKALIDADLATREFMPRIERLVQVSTFSTPSTWTVETDRGTADFVLKGEEDIRRLGGSRLLITAEHGVLFTVPDFRALDRASRRLLERFL